MNVAKAIALLLGMLAILYELRVFLLTPNIFESASICGNGSQSIVSPDWTSWACVLILVVSLVLLAFAWARRKRSAIVMWTTTLVLVLLAFAANALYSSHFFSLCF